MVHLTELETFVKLHENQLVASGVPQIYWPTLHTKLATECFDSGNTFLLVQIVCSEENESSEFLLKVNDQTGIDRTDPKHVYLVDHAWTFRVEFAKKQLVNTDYLRSRMASVMGIDPSGDKLDVAERIFDEVWRYANTYSICNAGTVEERLPVWYVTDEMGCAVSHSDAPNFRMVPFFHVPEGISYSLLFPINDIAFADVVTRDFAEGFGGETREAVLLPWVQHDFTKRSFRHVETSPDYFLSGHIAESLPILDKLTGNERKQIYKVYAEYELVREYLKDPHFEIVDSEDQADVLWHTKHFKDFEELSNHPGKFVNQFPFEYVLTIKDLLCITCRRRKEAIEGCLDIPPKWLPTTYNLKTEVTQFVSYFQNREAAGLDNHWIIKPFNLARGLDTHITKNLNYIMRLATTGSKISQKYIENPVLYEREECGRVKFDIRYVILLKSAKPLSVYVYKNFFLRFANKPFALSDFDEYEQHFTVMNYNENAALKHMQCSEFLERWGQQYPNNAWDGVEHSILDILKEVFECATIEHPPCGISESPQSRALYAVDLMLEWDLDAIQPKILEINWTPDCKRACEYYPDFYDNIFRLLFLNDESSDAFHKL